MITSVPLQTKYISRTEKWATPLQTQQSFDNMFTQGEYVALINKTTTKLYVSTSVYLPEDQITVDHEYESAIDVLNQSPQKTGVLHLFGQKFLINHHFVGTKPHDKMLCLFGLNCHKVAAIAQTRHYILCGLKRGCSTIQHISDKIYRIAEYFRAHDC